MRFNPRRLGRRHESDPDAQAARFSRESLVTYRRLLTYIQPYRGWMLFSIIALLFSVALNLILPLVIQNLVDVVLIVVICSPDIETTDINSIMRNERIIVLCMPRMKNEMK